MSLYLDVTKSPYLDLKRVAKNEIRFGRRLIIAITSKVTKRGHAEESLLTEIYLNQHSGYISLDLSLWNSDGSQF